MGVVADIITRDLHRSPDAGDCAGLLGLALRRTPQQASMIVIVQSTPGLQSFVSREKPSSPQHNECAIHTDGMRIIWLISLDLKVAISYV